MKKELLGSGLIRMLSGLLLMGLLLFLPAGTWHYPGAWRLLGLLFIPMPVIGIVRHPMYMAVTILFLSMPLVLGSAIAIIPFLGVPAVLVKRIRNEEMVLVKGLPGYEAYQKKVTYRMIPFLW